MHTRIRTLRFHGGGVFLFSLMGQNKLSLEQTHNLNHQIEKP